MLLCRLYYPGLSINIYIPFMQLNSHNALFNNVQLNRLKCLFVRGGQNWSFCRCWNNGVDECVGSCLPVICDVRKERRICRHFYSSFTHFVLAACKVCGVLPKPWSQVADQQKTGTSSARKAEQLDTGLTFVCGHCCVGCCVFQDKQRLNWTVMSWNCYINPCHALIVWTSSASCWASAYLSVVSFEWKTISWHQVQVLLPLTLQKRSPIFWMEPQVWWIENILVHSCMHGRELCFRWSVKCDRPKDVGRELSSERYFTWSSVSFTATH